MTRTSRIAAALVLLSALAGCQGPLRPVFEKHEPPIVWPPSPDRPRIAYIGSLSGEDSLNKPKPVTLKSLLAGPEPTIGFSTPTSVAARGDDLFVCDGQNQAVYHLNLTTRDFRAITHADGEQFGWPSDVTLADQHLAIADGKRAAIFIMTLQGADVRTMGKGTLKRPSAVGWNPQRREYWVLDTGAHACVIFDEDGAEKSRFGQRGESLGEFNYPAGLVCDDRLGALIADSMNFRVQTIDAAGLAKHMFGKKGDAAGDFSLPRDVATDSDGHIYVLDNQFENVQVFDSDGRLLMAWGQEGHGPGEFYLPSGISIDAQDRIWIADTYNRRVQVFQYLPEESGTAAEEQEAK